MEKKRKNINYKELVEVFNTHGKESADKYIADYCDLSNKYVYTKLLKQGYFYNRTQRKYLLAEASSLPFMTLDALYTPTNQAESAQELLVTYEEDTDYGMDKLVVELINEKLLELSRFIKVNSNSRTITIHKKLLLASGYKIREC